MSNENNKWKEKLENVQDLEIENTLLKQRLRTIFNVANINKGRRKTNPRLEEESKY